MSSITHVEERYEFADSVPEQGAGVSWGAIMAGAVTAAALSLILLALGSGLGLSNVSPWSYQGASATALAPATIGWLVFMSAAASGVGGYVAGRLRARWQFLHDHEVYFRDTAHGLVAWAVATVITAAALTSAAGSMVGAVARIAASGTVAAVDSALPEARRLDGAPSRDESGQRYLVDQLFRTPEGKVETDQSTARREAATLLAAGPFPAHALAQDDRDRLATLVAQQTGLSPADAQQRISHALDQARERASQLRNEATRAADEARRSAATLALWVFVSLLAGAFCAALAATFGGRRRDAATLRPLRRGDR